MKQKNQQSPRHAEILRAVQAHLGCNSRLAAVHVDNACADAANGIESSALAAIRVGLTPADLRVWSGV